MQPVADERGEEAVQPARGSAAEERDEPLRDRGEEHGDRPEHKPDQVRQREQDPEEDGQPRAAQVVWIPDDTHGMTRRPVDDREEHLRRVGVRVAIRDEEDVRGRLGRVADRVGARVAEALRHSPSCERREPAQHRADEQQGAAAVEAPGLAP